MTKFLKLKIVSVLFCLLLGVNFAPAAKAASFSISPQDLAAGKETAVVLSIDTENQEINAISLHLKFSPDNFSVKDISDGNSIINFWVEKPNFSNEKGELIFSGIIPGGFQEANGQLLKIILSPNKTGEASLEISEAKVLLNDGKGTEAGVNTSNLKFNVKESGFFQEASFPAKDTNPPEDFTPEIASDPDIFAGKYFLVFSTQDKGSGIDHYEIMEKPDTAIYVIKSLLGLEKDKWIIAESPYLLADQKLAGRIYVKAVDKAGNARIAAVLPKNPPAWYENYLMYAIIVPIALIAAIVCIFWRKLWKKFAIKR